MKSYDLVIVGSGSAATSAAYRCLEADWSIAVIDHKPIGGTCALRGCDPKKVIYGVAEAANAVRRLQGRGISLSGKGVSWNELIRFKETFTQPMSANIEDGLKSSGIDVVHGHAGFTGKNTLEAEGQEFSAKKILVASGVKASRQKFPGSEHMIDNEGFLGLRELPRRLIFVGGGYISVEFANIARSSGSEATIIQHSGRILKNFDPYTVDALWKSMERKGIRILADSEITGIEENDGDYRVAYRQNGKENKVYADLVVHGAGREFDSTLVPEKAGIEFTASGIKVNGYLQSVSNPDVYSAGDAADTGAYKLTPVAGMEGSVAAENMINGNTVKADYTGTPTVVFSSPPLAMVGMTEEEASAEGLEFSVKKGESTSWYNSRRLGMDVSAYKVLLERDTGRILGAHILGPNSEEVINTVSLAIRKGITAHELSAMPFSYPSDTYDLKYML